MHTEDSLIIMIALKLRGRTGRYHLVNLLGIGEGVIKDRLRELKEAGLIQSSRSGSVLTNGGIRKLNELLNNYGIINIQEIDLTPVFRRKYNYCVMGGLMRWPIGVNIIELRDIGVKNGGDAVLIMHVDCTSVNIPLTDLTVERYSPELATRIKSTYPCSTYVIAVCGRTLYYSLRGLIEMAKAVSITEMSRGLD
ncbi:DUF4443 domain-containing protein [Caldivirga sp. UBA161]|uniref:DUF4443 domain-containing protein n=1 Tax=Caldivirga sp. UBA161 TaxID=1915569 RepID=UPI0025C10CB2|nr:DUF4443 domain-containing protein [Caldivirga sp. UBA161]